MKQEESAIDWRRPGEAPGGRPEEDAMRAVNLLLSLSLCFACRPAAPPDPPPGRGAAAPPAPVSPRLADPQAAGQFNAAVTSFDEHLNKLLPAGERVSTWRRFLDERRALRGHAPPRPEASREGVGVPITCELERGLHDARISVPGGRLAGLRFQPTASAAARARIPDATRLVEHLAAGRFAAVVAMLDARMSRVLPAGKLRESWGCIVDEMGAFRRVTAAVTEGRDDLVAVVLTCAFARGPRTVRVIYRVDRVAGLFFPD